MKNTIKIALTLAVVLLSLGGCAVIPATEQASSNESRFQREAADPDTFWSAAQRHGRQNMTYNPCVSANPDDLKNRDVGFISSSTSTEDADNGKNIVNKAKTRNNSDCAVSDQ